MAVWVVGYLVLFGILTLQDRLSGPQPVPYTDFKTQVTDKNVAELFARGDSIEGQLKKAVAIPGQQDRTYQQFTTERPTFASDDLLTELTEGGATVRATPLVQQRGFLANLLISFAPLLLLVGFYIWMFKRQQGAMAGGLLGAGKQKRVDPETVRVTFEVSSSRSSCTQGRTAGRCPWYREDPTGARHGGRGQGPVLQRQRIGVHRDDRGRGSQSGARALLGRAEGRAGDHLHR
jgi:hypothetical protein